VTFGPIWGDGIAGFVPVLAGLEDCLWCMWCVEFWKWQCTRIRPKPPTRTCICRLIVICFGEEFLAAFVEVVPPGEGLFGGCLAGIFGSVSSASATAASLFCWCGWLAHIVRRVCGTLLKAVSFDMGGGLSGIQGNELFYLNLNIRNSGGRFVKCLMSLASSGNGGLLFLGKRDIIDVVEGFVFYLMSFVDWDHGGLMFLRGKNIGFIVGWVLDTSPVLADVPLAGWDNHGCLPGDWLVVFAGWLVAFADTGRG